MKWPSWLVSVGSAAALTLLARVLSLQPGIDRITHLELELEQRVTGLEDARRVRMVAITPETLEALYHNRRVLEPREKMQVAQTLCSFRPAVLVMDLKTDEYGPKGNPYSDLRRTFSCPVVWAQGVVEEQADPLIPGIALAPENPSQQAGVASFFKSPDGWIHHYSDWFRIGVDQWAPSLWFQAVRAYCERPNQLCPAVQPRGRSTLLRRYRNLARDTIPFEELVTGGTRNDLEGMILVVCGCYGDDLHATIDGVQWGAQLVASAIESSLTVPRRRELAGEAAPSEIAVALAIQFAIVLIIRSLLDRLPLRSGLAAAAVVIAVAYVGALAVFLEFGWWFSLIPSVLGAAIELTVTNARRASSGNFRTLRF
jgi:CHASE2 domain-containing sensor protein